MSSDLKYQIRLYLTDEFSTAARADARDPSLQPLNDILDTHGLKLMNQFDALLGFLEEAEANGNTDTDLYRWTKAITEMPSKAEYYHTQFTLYALNNDQVYDRDVAAQALLDLKFFADRNSMITDIKVHNDDPAQNPQAPAKFQKKPDEPEV